MKDKTIFTSINKKSFFLQIYCKKKYIRENMLDINSLQFLKFLSVKNHNLFIISVLLTIQGISSYIFNSQSAYFHGKLEMFSYVQGSFSLP